MEDSEVYEKISVWYAFGDVPFATRSALCHENHDKGRSSWQKERPHYTPTILYFSGYIHPLYARIDIFS